MKKFCYAVLVLVVSLIVAACPDESDNNGNNVDVKTGRVTFFNESSYKVLIHQDAFSGPVLLELSAGDSKKVDVRTSDNYGVGSTFSIEYISKIQIHESVNDVIREVFASAIDPNVQINRVIEEGKSYTVQIPQPQNLEPRSAFIKVQNLHSLPFELRYLGTVFKQEDNNNISVAPGQIGIYKLEGIPAEGKLFQNYAVASTFESTNIPDFTAMNGIIYSFTYNGTSVTKTGEQTIIF